MMLTGDDIEDIDMYSELCRGHASVDLNLLGTYLQAWSLKAQSMKTEIASLRSELERARNAILNVRTGGYDDTRST